ncbi:hypothetical protein GH714_038717 [Hevea brasiliensis]|uniref:Retrotransposon gag domain-containing protein n=1 Tax=Hevea brasiliensis TaxID=3981 RepID=A0A6A6LBU8_HEVBR|nr:hypothetical protein GH714_038717 [Hevea brasiliensis]
MDEIKALLAGLSLQNMELEFPRFSGEGLEGWLLRVDYLFEVANVAADDRVKMAVLHLEGKALQWHQRFFKVKGPTASLDWGAYVGAITARFGSNGYEDPLADLRNLKQVSSLQDYLDAFDEIYPKAGLRKDQALSFLSFGLEENKEDEETEGKGIENEMVSDMMRQGFLGSTMSSADLILFALYMFVIARNDMRMCLVRHLLSDPTGATMIRTYLTV